MNLIVISDPGFVANEAELINSLFDAGLECFHLRKPATDMEGVRQLVNGVYPRYRLRIALHQHHALAGESGIRRLHFPETAREKLPADALQALRGAGYLLSTSVHNIAQIPAMAGFNYVLFGPVFNSISKPGYESTLTAGFRLGKGRAMPEVVAIGGITSHHLAMVKNMNFDGAAALGAIWQEPAKAVENFKQMQLAIAALNQGI